MFNEKATGLYYRQAFLTAPVSRQEYFEGDGPQYGNTNVNKNSPEVTEKIQNALNFIRNQIFEASLLKTFLIIENIAFPYMITFSLT